MTSLIRRFYADSLSPVSVMTASGFFGLMKMDALIFDPTEIGRRQAHSAAGFLLQIRKAA